MTSELAALGAAELARRVRAREVSPVEVVRALRDRAETVGPRVENHPSFPRRTNTHFVQIVSPKEVRMRTWERGCGETLACGTGACAVTVAGVLGGRTERDLLLHVRGGDLRVRWDEKSDHVYLTGPAVEVFTGTLPPA